MQKLRVLRAEKRMTLRDLAKSSGVSKDAISEIERGNRTPRIQTLLNLANGLGVDPKELISEISQMPQEPPYVVNENTTMDHHVKELSEGVGPFTAVYQRDGEWWIGFVEELPGANGQGESLEEARESLREAVSLVLDANREITRTEFEGGDVVREPLSV